MWSKTDKFPIALELATRFKFGNYTARRQIHTFPLEIRFIALQKHHFVVLTWQFVSCGTHRPFLILVRALLKKDGPYQPSMHDAHYQ